MHRTDVVKIRGKFILSCFPLSSTVKCAVNTEQEFVSKSCSVSQHRRVKEIGAAAQKLWSEPTTGQKH